MLRDDQAAGQELEFDLDEGHRRGGPALYHYRPLTSKYIADRWSRLRFLPSAAEACEALDSGASAYLRLNGLRGAEAEPALRALLERLYEELSDFAFPEERFERVYAEVEGTLYEKSQSATVLVPVHGLEMQGERVDLGDGLSPGPRRPDRRARRGRLGRRRASEPSALLMLEREVAPDDPLPLADAREHFRRAAARHAPVQARRDRAGRRWPGAAPATGAGSPSSSSRPARPAACRGSWSRARRPSCARSWRRWRVAAAHRARGLGAVALPDGRRPPARGRGADRLPAGPARADRRGRVEPGAARGGAVRRGERAPEGAAPDRAGPGHGAVRDRRRRRRGLPGRRGLRLAATLVEEVERHLRALLRDVLCGYLDADLRQVADELLLDQPEPFEIRAASLKPAAPEAAHSSRRSRSSWRASSAWTTRSTGRLPYRAHDLP